jgi:hypothetical protein
LLAESHVSADFMEGLMHALHAGSRLLRLLLLTLPLISSSLWAQKVAGPPSLQQLEGAEDNEPIQDDPWGRAIWMRQRFAGDPLDYKDMMLRETQRQRALYPKLEAGVQQGIVPASTPTWVNIGPTNAAFETNGVTLNVVDSGRARTILPDPADQNTVYLLTAGGGLWKTTNFLQTNPTWTPMTDNLFTTGGGSVAFGRTSNILYLGLGDPFDSFALAGGIMVTSSDGGNTWSAPMNLSNASQVRDVKVDTSGGSDIVLVATNVGLFRSTNGGASYDSTPNASIGGRALWSLAQTSAGWLVSAADGTLWLSINQGATWTATGTGFTGAGRSTLGIGLPGDNVVYSFAANPGGTDQLDLFRSIDGGQSWTALGVNTSKAPTNPTANNDCKNMDMMHGQAFYNQMIVVDPTSSGNTVYIGGNLCTAKSTDGGATWTLLTQWLAQSLPYAHADFHAAAISTLTSPPKLFFGSDGGLFVSNDSGASWDYRKNIGIVSHLIYALASFPNLPNSTIIGLQDNGTRVRESSTTIYDQTRGGDGFGVGASQANTLWALSTYVDGAVDNSSNQGANWATANSGINTADAYFSTPITNPAASADPTGAVFFTAGNNDVYETTNGGGGANSWADIGKSGTNGWTSGVQVRALVHVVGVSPVDTQHVAVAGTGGNLVLTTNGGASWTTTALNTAVPGYNSSNANIAWVDNNTLYVCSESPNPGVIRVVKSVNGGANWARADSGLPDVSISKLQVDPNDSSGNTLYAGTWIGVYQTVNGGASWQKFGAGLPNVHVTDIYMPPDGSLIRISTYGRGVWETTPSGVLPATHFQVTAPSTASAAVPFNITVTALDATNATVSSYVGTVHFTTTDGAAVLPANYTFTGGDAGVHTFSVTLKTLGGQTVTATDTGTSITGTSGTITVGPGPASHLTLTGAPASTPAGVAFNITVTAKDVLNNTATGYLGKVHFTSSDGQATLPFDYTFTGADAGVHVFSFVLGTLGSQTVTATDAGNSINGVSPGITVNPGATAHFKVQPSLLAVVAGNALSVTVTAQDAYNNTTTAYLGTVHFTSGDNQALLPADYTFIGGDAGVHTFSGGSAVTLKTAGQRTVNVNDTGSTSIVGVSSLITVNNAAASKYSMTSPPTATAGVLFTVRLVAQDQFNNTAKDYTGTVHFTTSDVAAGVILPGDYTYLPGDNGQKIFSNAFKLQTAGAQSITAKDTVTATITASNPITVTTDAFITPLGRSISMFRPRSLIMVATFTDADGAETGSNFSATIDWGDGTTPDSGCTTSSTNCKIVRVASTNLFNVFGSHTYKTKNVFTVKVALTDSGGSIADAFSTARFFPMNGSH